MEFHPVSNIFPLMSNKELSNLVEDINKNGLLESITTFENKILDGRNRFLACEKVKVAPHFKEFHGKDPISFIVSLNVKRRHLNESQRAIVGAKLANMARGRERKSDKSAHVHFNVSLEKAAEMLNISRRLVCNAKMIMEKAPERIEEIQQGEKTINEVKKEIRKIEREKKRQEAIREGEKIKEETVFIQTIEDLDLDPDSIDLIITDPPYDDEHIKHYEMVARLAAKSLKPGRFFCCYAGKLRLPEVINVIIPHLEYIWCIAVFHAYSREKHLGAPYQFAENWRPVLIFKKAGKTSVCKFQQDVVRATRDKEFHDWQQDMSTPLQLIEAYTEPGELVIDPFCGGGTILVAAKKLGRRWIGFDSSEDSIALSKRRLYGNH